MINDLKQQVANTEEARTLAENQLHELRITQKAVGQPTEVGTDFTLHNDSWFVALLLTLILRGMLQCVSLQGRRFTAEEVFAELEMRNRQIEELEAKAAVHASELTHAQLERDWAKDEQRRAEGALAQSRTRKVGPFGQAVCTIDVRNECDEDTGAADLRKLHVAGPWAKLYARRGMLGA